MSTASATNLGNAACNDIVERTLKAIEVAKAAAGASSEEIAGIEGTAERDSHL